MQITSHGQRHIGVALWKRDFAKEYVAAKIKSWTAEVFVLEKATISRPHAAYCAFTYGR